MPSIPPLFGDLKLKWKYSNNQLVLVYKFSKNKTANSYSLGGEDGLDETPYFINDSGDFEYLGMPKWAIFNISSIHKVKIFKRLIDLNFQLKIYLIYTINNSLQALVRLVEVLIFLLF